MVNLSTPIPIEHYQQLLEVSLDLASTLDLTALLERINCLALELTDAEAASIFLYDERKKELSFAIADNPETEAMLTNVRVPMNSIAGYAVQTRESVFVPDVHQDQRFFGNVEKLLQFPTRSIIATPMIAKGKVIGVLEVINKKVEYFNESDLGKLQVLSAQAAVAIENSRLFQQIDLISDFVHELRTPLTSLSAVANLLQRDDLPAEQRKQYGELVQREIQRLKDLSNDFLDYSRLESGRLSYHLARVAPRDLINECIEVMQAKAQARKVNLLSSMPAQLPDIEADRDKIKQVILNILSNAIKYNRPGGQVLIKAWSDGGTVSISVQDSGIGIPAEELERITERFFRAKNAEEHIDGTGLGMCICKHILDEHHGTLSIQSELNIGSTFTVQLPAK